MRAIVRNCAIDLQRRRGSSDHNSGTATENPSRNPVAQAQQQELLHLLREMVDSLPAAYHDVCELRYGQQLSEAETARRLGISASNVSTRLYRAVRMLRKRLDDRLGDHS